MSDSVLSGPIFRTLFIVSVGLSLPFVKSSEDLSQYVYSINGNSKSGNY